jgi:hypothetical protein
MSRARVHIPSRLCEPYWPSFRELTIDGRREPSAEVEVESLTSKIRPG